MGWGCYRNRARFDSRSESAEDDQSNEMNILGDKEAINTNIINIHFDDLLEKQEIIHQGDPIICESCEAIFNKYSQIVKKLNKQVWICEFCEKENNIQIEDEERPKNDDTVFLLESKQEVQEKKKAKTSNRQMQVELDNSILFCIDLSGSMAQHLQYVLSAITQQIIEIEEKHPNKKIGVITFESFVEVFGDFGQPSFKLVGKELEDQAQIEQKISQKVDEIMKLPIKKQLRLILNQLKKMRTGGITSLGPGLLVALELAIKGKPGSTVILCTDGLANHGLGNIDNKEQEALEFYTNLGYKAKEFGVQISIITIKGSQCRLDILNTLADSTQGNVSRINAQDIGKDMNEMIKDQIIAVKAEIAIHLHHALKIKESDSKGEFKLKRKIGNITMGISDTFEYVLKNKKELEAQQISIERLSQVPIQVRVNYESLDGDKYVWITTKVFDTAKGNEEEEEELVEEEILQNRMVKLVAEKLEKGDLKKAHRTNLRFKNYMETVGASRKADNQISEKFKSGLTKNRELEQFVNKRSKKQNKAKSKGKDLQSESGSEDEDMAKIQKLKKSKK